MKTETDINNELANEIQIAESIKRNTGSVPNKNKCHIRYLRHIQKYLQTKPSEKFLNKTLEDLIFTKKTLLDRYLLWKQSNPNEVKQKNHSQILSYYKTKYSINKISDQIKTIKYILENDDKC